MTTVDPGLPVVILKFHHGSLGIARSLGRWGVRVYGIDPDPQAFGLASRYCRKSYCWNFRRNNDEQSLAFLQELARDLGEPALLVPTTDNTAILVAEHADTLRAASFVFPRQDPEVVRSLSNKKDLYHLARRLQIPTAETSFPASRGDVERFLESAAFPVMLKGIDGNLLEARTGKKMVIVRNADELLREYASLEDPEHPNLMLQEYIPGGDDTIWMFNGYFNRDSECMAAFTGKKIRQNPIHTGATSLGICTWNETVAAQTLSFMKAIGYQGVLDIGWRFDARDGQYKLLDPNPRIGSTFRLFLDRDGMDVVRFLYLDMTGQPLPRAVPREGRKWLVEDKDIESSIDYWREQSLGAGEYLRSFSGVQEGAWFAVDDPLPFLRMCRFMMGRLLRWMWRRIRGGR